MRKILLAIFVLLLCMVTCNALAESGTCGDNLTWTLEDGVLTISGTGDMYDYEFTGMEPTNAPWIEYQEEISSLIVSDGVTSIGDYAFAYCGLDSVVLPNSLRINGYEAFALSGLSAIEIPEGVTYVGDDAFRYCHMRRVSLPTSLVEVGVNPFSGCYHLTEIFVAEGNLSFVAKDGVLYSRDMKTLICYPNGKADLTVFKIPDGVTTIAASAFYYNPTLSEVVFPNS